MGQSSSEEARFDPEVIVIILVSFLSSACKVGVLSDMTSLKNKTLKTFAKGHKPKLY